MVGASSARFVLTFGPLSGRPAFTIGERSESGPYPEGAGGANADCGGRGDAERGHRRSDLLSSDDEKSPQPGTPAPASDGGSSGGGSSDGGSSKGKAGSCAVDSCPQLPTPSGDFTGSGITADNVATKVTPFLTSLLDDLDKAWGAWFTELNWGDPSAGRKLIEPGTTFETDCTDGDNKIGAVSPI